MNLVLKGFILVLTYINVFKFLHILNKPIREEHLIWSIMEILMLNGWQIIIKILLKTKIWLIVLNLIHTGINIHVSCVHSKNHTSIWNTMYVHFAHKGQHIMKKFMNAWVMILELSISNQTYRKYWQESYHDYLWKIINIKQDDKIFIFSELFSIYMKLFYSILFFSNS